MTAWQKRTRTRTRGNNVKMWTRRECIVMGPRKPKGDWVEINALDGPRCRRARLEELVPDIAATLSKLNSNMLTVVETLEKITRTKRS